MRQIIDIDWSVVFDRLEYVKNKYEQIDSSDYVERMEFIKSLYIRLRKGERSNDLFMSIMDLKV